MLAFVFGLTNSDGRLAASGVDRETCLNAGHAVRTRSGCVPPRLWITGIDVSALRPLLTSVLARVTTSGASRRATRRGTAAPADKPACTGKPALDPRVLKIVRLLARQAARDALDLAQIDPQADEH
jgi:hypothetical protein